ncbi:MAG: putative aspartate dehydrogenase [Variovorax paradoxus]|nr:MAG: putative aspartate dehydrogenase [Variovorax paradoxus]PZQ00055.1 MAG: putative aspartate dehydrogenase [Variovorax paradoxus]
MQDTTQQNPGSTAQGRAPGKRIHRVAIAGLGLVGLEVARHLDAGIPGMVLSAVGVRDRAKATGLLAGLKTMPVLADIDALEPHADIVVECAPAALLASAIEPFLLRGKKAIVLSAGALLSNPTLIDLADAHGGQILVPSGALLGLDAVSAAAEGTIHSVKMVTRKPTRGLMGAPYLTDNNIRIDDIRQPLRVFSGSPRDAAIGFPANLNVAVALSLAGIGPDATTLEIWADPALERNTHSIEVQADSAHFSMAIENIPSANPKTGLITALSVVAMLRRFESPLRIG